MYRKNKRKKKRKGDCTTCFNANYCGEGCYICLEDVEPKIVMDEFQPTQDFNWCCGRKYEER